MKLISVSLAAILCSCATSPKKETRTESVASPAGMMRGADGTLYLAKDAPTGSMPVEANQTPQPEAKSKKAGKVVGNVLAGVLVGLGEGARAYSASQPLYVPRPSYSASSAYSDLGRQMEMDRLNRSIRANTDAINNLNYSTYRPMPVYRPMQLTPIRPVYIPVRY